MGDGDMIKRPRQHFEAERTLNKNKVGEEHQRKRSCQHFEAEPTHVSLKKIKMGEENLRKRSCHYFEAEPAHVLPKSIKMEEELPRKRPRQHFEDLFLLESPLCDTSMWYFSKEEIDRFSPSRKDGIDLMKESFVRSSYCTFLQRLGMKLHVSQVIIGCSMLMCHRFYMRQSLAKNDWQTIATSSLFLACKSSDEPCQLSSIVVASYETIFEWDPSASIRIHQAEYYHQFKEIVLTGERLLLDTCAFHNLDIELPYKPLTAALNRLNTWPNLATSAWNMVHDWLRTTLCLQYKPHVIATATVHLAATFQNVTVGSRRDWWVEFGVTTKLLKEVVQEMCRLIEVNRMTSMPPPPRRHVAWAVPAPIKPMHMAGGYPFQSYPFQSYIQPGIW